jgi:hypothetical protein
VIIVKTRTSPVNNKRIASSVKASMEFEGLQPSAYAQRIGEHYLKGKISSREALEKIKAKHASKFGR